MPAALSSADHPDSERAEKISDLRYGVERIRLVGRDELLHLAVVAGFGEEPMLLLTNALAGVQDSRT